MKIYVDSEFKCHPTNQDGVFREVETDFFEDGTCSEFIEGFCYDDSKGYTVIYPWKNFYELDAAQREYKRQLLAKTQKELSNTQKELAELDALMLEMQYQNLISSL